MTAEVTGRREEFFTLRFSTPVVPVLERLGQVPLPPYIRPNDDPATDVRYQTVLRQGAGVGGCADGRAALRPDVAGRADRARYQPALTLHVGAGTFAPLRSDPVETRRLHHEWLEVETRCVGSAPASGGVAAGFMPWVPRRAWRWRRRRGRVSLRPYAGDTNLFICPGYRFQVVDAMVTNFHLPESSLLMLVAAFGGT